MHRINGILLLYHHPISRNAPTIMEHVRAFEQHSQFRVWALNTELGLPPQLDEIEFAAVILHYSLFNYFPYGTEPAFLRYLQNHPSSYKIAFFQDEHHYCQARFAFLNQHSIDCVYTLLEPAYFKDVYQKYTRVPKMMHTLTGYVSGDLIELAERLTLPDAKRTIDIGYRARRLDLYMGKGGQEKSEIAEGFLARAGMLNLRLDIRVGETARIYGKHWHKFLANCRGVLGVETGVSIFDLDDAVRTECARRLAANPNASFAELAELLEAWEDNIYYRTIGPRHFEAAALRVCQILFEGKYSDILQPMVHYIPLKKDFSNFAEVMRLFQDAAVRNELTENAYRDLIASESYSYRRFIHDFDRELIAEGFQPAMDAQTVARVTRIARQDEMLRALRAHAKNVIHSPFPGRKSLKRLAKPTLNRIGIQLHPDEAR